MVDEYGQRPKLDWRDYLEARPGVVSGAMCVKNTRMPVWAIMNELSTGTREEILKYRTNLTSEDIDAALSYARDVLAELGKNGEQVHEAIEARRKFWDNLDSLPANEE